MLTIFTITKPFIGNNEIIQRNAIQSWKFLIPSCEIILCGDDQGVQEVAKEYEVNSVLKIAYEGQKFLRAVITDGKPFAQHFHKMVDLAPGLI